MFICGKQGRFACVSKRLFEWKVLHREEDFMQKVIDNLLAFYGTVDDQIDSENIRNIIKSGKRIERIDIYARLGASRKELKREIDRMIPRVKNSGLDYDCSKLDRISEYAGRHYETKDIRY